MSRKKTPPRPEARCFLEISTAVTPWARAHFECYRDVSTVTNPRRAEGVSGTTSLLRTTSVDQQASEPFCTLVLRVESAQASRTSALVEHEWLSPPVFLRLHRCNGATPRYSSGAQSRNRQPRRRERPELPSSLLRHTC